MKNKLLTLFVCIWILILCIQSVLAAQTAVIDECNLLSGEEAEKLEAMAQDLSDETDYNIYIVTCDSLDGRHPETAADDWYDDLADYNDDGVLLLIAMEERKWAICGYGECYNLIDAEHIGYQIQGSLGNGDYYEAFSQFLDCLWDSFLESEDNFYPGEVDDDFHDTENSNGYDFSYFLIAVVISLAAAGIGILIMRSSMNTAKAQSGASDYLVNGSYRLNVHRDIYLYSHTSKTAKPKNNGSSGGHSGGGRSGGGRASGGF